MIVFLYKKRLIYFKLKVKFFLTKIIILKQFLGLKLKISNASKVLRTIFNGNYYLKDNKLYLDTIMYLSE